MTRDSDARCWLAAGWEIPRLRAPSVTDPLRYTATKVRNHSARLISRPYSTSADFYFANSSTGRHRHGMTSYTLGHHESVLRSHQWRTAENSASYLLPHLRVGDRVLDVGCGPGTISADLADVVGQRGSVVGIDNADAVIQTAKARYDGSGRGNLVFATGDALSVDYADNAFDVVHAHQVLQHLQDPVGALREFARVTRPGGIVAVRDADYAAMTWHPHSDALDAWLALYREVARSNGAEPDAGRRLLEWSSDAGLAEVLPSASVWCFATPGEREWWGGLQADRIRESAVAEQAVQLGLADAEALDRIAEAWQKWAATPTAWFAVLHGEVLCRKGAGHE